MTKLPNIEPVGMPISGQFVIGSSKKVHRTSHNRPSDSSHLGASLTPVLRVSERQANDRAWLLVRFMTRPLRAEDRPRLFLGLVNKVPCFRRVEHRRRYRQTERHHDHAQ